MAVHVDHASSITIMFDFGQVQLTKIGHSSEALFLQSSTKSMLMF